MEERLKDLHQGDLVAKFRAFDPSSWPACNRADPVENERFRQCGVDEMREMATFYQELLRKAGIEVDEVLAEYNHYKIFAKGRAAVPMRELFMSVLQSGVNIECRMCDRLVKCQII